MRLNPANSSETVHVGIAELAISAEPERVLIAPNLGSCLGVAVYDPVMNVGGLVHCLLPLSGNDPEKARSKPCTFVDSGVVLLLQEILALGANKKTLVIKAAGGSMISDKNGFFEIGKRNHTALRKVLWKNDLLLAAEDVGGSHPRTLSLHIGSGMVHVRTADGRFELGERR